MACLSETAITTISRPFSHLHLDLAGLDKWTNRDPGFTCVRLAVTRAEALLTCRLYLILAANRQVDSRLLWLA